MIQTHPVPVMFAIVIILFAVSLGIAITACNAIRLAMKNHCEDKKTYAVIISVLIAGIAITGLTGWLLAGTGMNPIIWLYALGMTAMTAYVLIRNANKAMKAGMID